MTDTDYVVRSSSVTRNGDTHFCVVDMHGRIAWITVDRVHAVNGGADREIRHRLEAIHAAEAKRP